jgi:RNA polymerase sigma-70 factor, ECF subfamily
MNPDADATDLFEAHRQRLIGLGYRMLGTVTGAEDAVQEAYLRWHRTARDGIVEPAAWLTATVTRLCIDELRAERTRREAYVGPWLPEPWVATAEDAEAEPVDRYAELADDLSIAFLLVLERLGPEERAALLLHDVFEASYADIAATLGKSEAAVRQIVTRARQRAATDRKRYPVTAGAQRELIRRFSRALVTRDQEELLALFHPDAELLSDGGGKVLAALRPIFSAAKITRFFLGITKDLDLAHIELRECWINGAPGFVAFDGAGRLIGAFGFEVDGGRFRRVFVMRNPDKLRRLPYGDLPCEEGSFGG